MIRIIAYKKNKIIMSQKTNYKFGLNPRLEYPNEKGQLTWYVIGETRDFNMNKPTQIKIRDMNYIIWRDKYNYYGIRDACSHQGSSFKNGCINKNTIICPYHGYTFTEKGKLKEIPKLEIKDNIDYKIKSYKVIEKDGLIYMNTVEEDEIDNKIDNNIWIEQEYTEPNSKSVMLTKEFEHYAKFVTVNSLDICHIGFVHTFGNKESPNPITHTNIKKINDTEYHYKITYEYMSGKESLVKKIYNMNKIIVENEYILPHTTIARVKFGNYKSTIITHALPISKFKTKLFVKAYRNYLYQDIIKTNILLVPITIIMNKLGDYITYKTMAETLQQDKEIIDNIDKYDYESMHGKFSIIYDALSTHYKKLYKKIYENDKEL